MKALTLHQPWAWLVAEGLKQYETRSWATSYRGPLAIHAGKRKPVFTEISIEILSVLKKYEQPMLELPYGAVVCVADLVDCIPSTPTFAQSLDLAEFAFGNFTPGRFAWKLANVRKIEPVAAKGAQGLWEWVQP